MNDRSLTIRLREEQYAQLTILAQAQDTSLGREIRQAIDMYLRGSVIEIMHGDDLDE